MKISTIDNNSWYTLEVEKCDWMNHSNDETEPSISFELNNLHEDTKYPVPNETCFIMSMQDAKELHAWLGVVLNGS